MRRGSGIRDVRRVSRLAKLSVGAVAGVLASLMVVHHHKAPVTSMSTTDQGYHRVAYVYDGDTIKLDNGEHVRFIGIDAPESHANPKLMKDVQRRHIDQDTQIAMGKKAARFARSLLADKNVRLEYDVEPRDRYGRLLAYLYLEDGTFVNEKIIREGYAYPLTIPPNVRHANDFKRWFDEAREHNRGLWANNSGEGNV